ncbi:MAG: TonB-dependent receptor, partial [Bacteroidia bacterium]|nr:TonB-dependent receptor [Bacteroidia bacterium]
SLGRFKMMVEAGKKTELKIKIQGFKSQHITFTALKDTSLDIFMTSTEVLLDEITVQAEKENTFGVSRLNNVEGTTIYAGKKSEAVYVQDLNANLAANNSRQVFSKIPGINVFENDGSGATIGIGGRGLNPNRISNFNTRQNGYDISADALGYPESYYTPPTDAVERIEILRGAAGLQFGTQFGGMINYKFSEASTKKISGDFRQTSGSYGFINSFNSLSGTVKKVSYNTFYQFKHYDGWRKRSELNSHNAFASVKYQLNERIWIKAEYTYLNYLAQQPGGLLDKQFNDDPGQITRTRNWFRVKWNLVSLQADYKVTERTRISLNSFGLYAGRDALGVLNRTERPDILSENRNLLSDVYKNFGAELKLLQRYSFLKNNSHFLIGTRYYQGHTDRKQGDADTTNLAHFNYLNPDNLENSSYTFPSRNYAFFAENIFQLNSKWSVTPGMRYEIISTASEGYYRLMNKGLSSDTILLDLKVYDNRISTRSFLIGGIGTQLKLSKRTELYANFSQNYRSINFNDMRISNPNSQVDPNLKDESGYTVDGGFRGSLKNLLYFDVGVFMLQYNNRIGTALKVDSNTFQVVRYRTNIGSSRNTGVEAFAELDWMKLVNRQSKHKLSTFANFSYINAVYTSKDKAYNNKKVEYVPNMIVRAGVSYAFKKFGFTYQYSYTSEQYSDATNAKTSPSAIYGLIPAYSVMDLSVNYSWKQFTCVAGLNNLANATYFTRRAEGYPGPGIIPADPINFYLTLKVKL